MLDLILALLGGALLVGQALHFFWFAEDWVVANPSGRSLIPSLAAGQDRVHDGLETGAGRH